MIYHPHQYQSYATEFIITHPISAIFLECGLGKSVITLTAITELLKDHEIHKILIIAPLRVATNTWTEEIRKWDHTKHLSFTLVLGSEKQRRKALDEDVIIYIINRENVVWLSETGIFFFDTIIIDELSSFKSWRSKRFKALMHIRRNVTRMIGLTGTPASNGLMDLFGEYKVLDEGIRLGYSITQYREKYFVPNHYYGHVVYDYKLKPGAEEAIYKAVDDITISMQSKDYLQLPPVTYVYDLVTMSSQEKALYKKLKQEMILYTKDDVVDAKNAAVLAAKLMQLSNGCILGEQGIIPIHDKKLDKLEDLIEAANGKPVLIVYWYVHDFNRIINRFPKAISLRSTKQIQSFNAAKIPVALMQPASLGLGVNLQHACSQMIWYGPIWSLELYQQTNARIYRQGQKNPVIIHHIMTKDTIDEHIIKVLKNKDRVQTNFIDAVKAELTEDPDLIQYPFLT